MFIVGILWNLGALWNLNRIRVCKMLGGNAL